MTRPQTIQIFLPSGDPQGIRVAEITTRIVRVIEVPRSLLAEFLKMPEAQQVGVYYLVGPAEEGEGALLYIGQSGAVGSRLAQHNENKDFWNRALVVVSLTNSLTQTHVLFLEWLGIKDAKTAGRYALENGNSGAKPHTPAPLEADCHEIQETARVLLATLGYPVFESVTRPMERAGTEEFFCRANGAEGRGLYTTEGFVLLKGSTGRRENVPSIQGTSDERFRERLIESGVLRVEGDRVVVTKSHVFGSPSMAAVALLGRTANGWVEWKNTAGQTLHEVKRVGMTDDTT
ncbi:MAG: GIY-YIG nuclease family protein [Acidiferrobacterales bacterium]